jgi:SAM-dependent methyltransferase
MQEMLPTNPSPPPARPTTAASDDVDIIGLERRSLPLYQTVLAYAEVGPWTRILDVGCGAGLAAEVAAQRGALVAGIDADPARVAASRERTGGDFRVADFGSLPWPDGSFDVVTGFNSFGHAADPARAFAEARRVTRPGGLIWATVWAMPSETEAASLFTALDPLVPPRHPQAPGMFALSDPRRLCGAATAGGLGPEQLLELRCDFHWADLRSAIRCLDATELAAWARQFVAPSEVTEAHGRALARFRTPHGGYAARAFFRCLVARA